MAEFSSREMHVIKRALAIAALAVERVTERSHSDDANLRALLIKLVKSDVELVMYVREARSALAGELAPTQALSATAAGLKGIDLLESLATDNLSLHYPHCRDTGGEAGGTKGI